MKKERVDCKEPVRKCNSDDSATRWTTKQKRQTHGKNGKPLPREYPQNETSRGQFQ